MTRRKREHPWVYTREFSGWEKRWRTATSRSDRNIENYLHYCLATSSSHLYRYPSIMLAGVTALSSQGCWEIFFESRQAHEYPPWSQAASPAVVLKSLVQSDGNHWRRSPGKAARLLNISISTAGPAGARAACRYLWTTCRLFHGESHRIWRVGMEHTVLSLGKQNSFHYTGPVLGRAQELWFVWELMVAMMRLSHLNIRESVLKTKYLGSVYLLYKRRKYRKTTITSTNFQVER